MSFFRKSGTKNEATTSTGTSTATWQSIASVDTALLSSSKDNRNDDAGFLNPSAPSTKLSTSAWSEERTSQHQDFRKEALGEHQQKGCCSKCTEYLIEALHVIDVCIGIAAIVYGSLLCTQFEEPAMAAVIFCLIFGSVHVSSSISGIFSYASKRCMRCGLVVSAYTSAYIAFIYLTIMISLLVDSKGFFSYLEDHKDVMYLGENVVDNLKRLMPLVYSLLALFIVGEMSRFYVLRTARQRLILDDASNGLAEAFGAGQSGNNNLTEALLGSDNSSNVVVETEIGGEPRDATTDWWEK